MRGVSARPPKGIGVDLVDLSRARRFVRAHRSRLNSFFLPAECRIVARSAFPVRAFGVLFAAKEAVSKSLGVPVRHPGQLRDFEIRVRAGRMEGRWRKGKKARRALLWPFSAGDSIGVLALAL